MGIIHNDVRVGYLMRHPDVQSVMEPFLNGFDVTWANTMYRSNTNIDAFLIKPEKHISETFDLSREVVVVYTPYERFEPRVLQAIEQIYSENPIKSRAETISCILVSGDPNIENSIYDHTLGSSVSRIIIPIYIKSLLDNKSNEWYLRNVIADKFYIRDLFSDSLPILSDDNFFGRGKYYIDISYLVRRGENSGLFGLRKTGKTSLLFKIKRVVENEGISNVIYYDCKKPFIRKMRWYELLEDIASKITKKLYDLEATGRWDEKGASKSFYKLIDRIDEDNKKVCLIFDEIEYISFVSKTDLHWKLDQVDFWQTIWGAQSEFKSISFIIAGVNPSVSEQDTIEGIQNPLFGIVKNRYLTGFEVDDIKNMARKFGKRMGIRFSNDLIDEVYKNYGGHPMITRMVLSSINTLLSASRTKPIDANTRDYLDHKVEIEREISFYCKHVISEVKEFYPDEYEMLEMLATNQLVDFNELSHDPMYTNHLVNYGLIRKTANGWEKKMPIVFDYIKQQKGDYIVPEGERQEWITQRKNSIISEMRNLERIILRSSSSLLFGRNSFPEADKLMAIDVATDSNSFMAFVNSLNRSFVESIENYGVGLGDKNYFWSTVKVQYPNLWQALHIIKTYRHDADHLILNQTVSKNLDEYLELHLGKKYSKGMDVNHFVIQQRVLDTLLIAIRDEIEKLN